MRKIGITADCVCDLPDEYLAYNDIDIIYFYISTDTGRFRDGFEIDSRNIIEYLEDGGVKSETKEPSSSEFKSFFEKALKNNSEIIHVCISSGTSDSYKNALDAREHMGDRGKRVHIVDSYHLSTGMGHMIIKAVDMRDEGCTSKEIVKELDSMKKRVSSSFITRSADYLYRNGRVSKLVRDITAALKIYPVLTMKKGKMALKTIQIGSYDKAVIRYIRNELRYDRRINKGRLFVTHAGCTVKTIGDVRAEIDKLCSFDEVVVTTASATVSSNCGPGTLGVLYVYES